MHIASDCHNTNPKVSNGKLELLRKDLSDISVIINRIFHSRNLSAAARARILCDTLHQQYVHRQHKSYAQRITQNIGMSKKQHFTKKYHIVVSDMQISVP